MNDISKTLYIPLYGKALVSRRGILLQDPKAEEIWAQVQFPLRRRSRSKWLAFFMAMRARVFDDWTRTNLDGETLVLHIGCGMDSRYLRVGNPGKCWYDVDLPEVIAARRRFFREDSRYHMLEADAAAPQWVAGLPEGAQALVLLEGISMYLKPEELRALFQALDEKFPQLRILMDGYTELGAWASRYKNPVREVGVTQVYGTDDPGAVREGTRIQLVQTHSITPDHLVQELTGLERRFFSAMFAGALAQKMYRIHSYEKR